MTPEQLRALEACPEHLGSALAALWLTQSGQWDMAHSLVQDANSGDEAWVHAHLHRIEGDEGNARYWYARAGRQPSRLSHEQEWNEIVSEILNRK